MIRVTVPFQVSIGIFVYGEIVKMHTIHERNYKVIKKSVMEMKRMQFMIFSQGIHS